MDYEEKYKEALERMRNTIIPPATKEGLQALKETVFPELAESKDERIRKEIVEFIQWAVDRGSVPNEQLQAKRPGEWLAYLEKQKEQQPAKCSDCKEYNRGFKRGREEGVTAGYNKAMKEMEQKEQKIARWKLLEECSDIPYGHYVVGWFRFGVFRLGIMCNGLFVDLNSGNRAEQPKEVFYIPNADEEYVYAEQKPTEWSEKEHKLLNYAISLTDDAEVKTFLESLRNQPKQEWSEEDEKIRSAILLMMKVPRKEIFEAQGITKEQALDWLERQKKTEGDQIIAFAKSGHGCQATAPPWDPETEHQCDCEHVGCHINNCRRWCRRYMAEIPYTNCGPTCSGYSHKNTGGISVKKPTWTGNDSLALVSLEAIINNSNHDEARKKELIDWLLTRAQNGFSHTPEEKEFVRTIRSLVADFIYQKKGVDTSYYQRLVDWVEKRHIESIEPLWTPTEAQMWALQEAVVRSCSSEYGGPLSEMLEMLNRALGRKTAWEKCKPGATDDNAVAFVYPSPEAWKFAKEGTKFSEDMLVVGADREPRLSRCAVNNCYCLPTSKILPPKSVTDKLRPQYGESHGEPAPDN